MEWLKASVSIIQLNSSFFCHIQITPHSLALFEHFVVSKLDCQFELLMRVWIVLLGMVYRLDLYFYFDGFVLKEFCCFIALFCFINKEKPIKISASLDTKSPTRDNAFKKNKIQEGKRNAYRTFPCQIIRINNAKESIVFTFRIHNQLGFQQMINTIGNWYVCCYSKQLGKNSLFNGLLETILIDVCDFRKPN